MKNHCIRWNIILSGDGFSANTIITVRIFYYEFTLLLVIYLSINNMLSWSKFYPKLNHKS